MVNQNKSNNDPVKKPNHYQGVFGMEAIDVVRNFRATPDYELGFYWGNAIKYMLRWHKKNGLQDLKKARQNLDWLIENVSNRTRFMDDDIPIPTEKEMKEWEQKATIDERGSEWYDQD